MILSTLLKPTQAKRTAFFIFLDILLSCASLYGAYALRFNFKLPNYALDDFWAIFAVLVLLKISIFYAIGIYKVPWRFFGLKNILNLVKAHIAVYLIFSTLFFIWHIGFLPRSVIVIDFVLSILALGGLRILKRIWLDSKALKEKPVVIVGADSNAEMAARWLDSFAGELYPIAFYSDEPHYVGTLIHGLKVLDTKTIAKFAAKNSIDTAIIAIEYDSRTLAKKYEFLRSIGIVNIKKAKFIDDGATQIEQIKIEDLLAREPKDLDKTTIKDFIFQKTILITGAGGSIGSEITRQCVSYGAKRIIAIDNSEFNLYAICDELKDANVVPVMQSVCDMQKLEQTFSKYMPQIVIHAAAYKHVPLVESNPMSAIENNIMGTKNTLECAIKYGAQKFTLISTDKAVRPTNIMGATKRVCELLAQNIKEAYPESKTEISAVRFGNVIGSSGSVVPKFRAQIASGGPITVTHPEIERYFMLISEACELTLQSAAIAKGGEIFILDMGERVKIVDLAKKMLELSGKSEEIEIVFSGLRPGEKLIEELLIDDAAETTKYPSIMIAFATQYDYETLSRQIAELFKCANVVECLKKIVPEFSHSPNS